MINRDALELIQATAVDAQRAEMPKEIDCPTVVKGKGLELVNIEHLQHNRYRFRGLFQTQDLSPFIAYTQAQGEAALLYGPAQVFVDAAQATAQAFFNLGSSGAPGHADHAAVLKLKPTAAFAALRRAVGQKFGQKELAEWIENWADLFGIEGGATVGQLINGVRNLDIKASRTARHQVGDLKASRSGLEMVEASSTALQLDGAKLSFRTAPYADFAERVFGLRIGVIADPDNPRLSLRELSAEQTDEAIAQEFEAKLIAGLPAAQVLRGTFKP
jgi:uncharacterized protein YfdQ (DUF2303 family)